MTPADLVRERNARTLADLLTVLERVHGTPLRDGSPVFPSSMRWCAVGRNLLYTDRDAVRLYASSHAGVLDAARLAGLSRPDCSIACDRCGARLRVVDVRNADRLHQQHQATEKCFYRAILLALVWRGFAPVDGAPRKYSPDQLEGLAALEGPGNERTARRKWAPTPRVLALTARRYHALLRGELLSPRDFETLQDPETIAEWEPAALVWTAEAIEQHAHDLHTATDVHTFLSTRVHAHLTP